MIKILICHRPVLTCVIPLTLPHTFLVLHLLTHCVPMIRTRGNLQDVLFIILLVFRVFFSLTLWIFYLYFCFVSLQGVECYVLANISILALALSTVALDLHLRTQCWPMGLPLGSFSIDDAVVAPVVHEGVQVQSDSESSFLDNII